MNRDGENRPEKEHNMNINRRLSMLAVAMLVSVAIAFPLVHAQGAAVQVSVSPEVVRACVGVERSIPENSLKGRCVLPAQGQPSVLIHNLVVSGDAARRCDVVRRTANELGVAFTVNRRGT